MTSSNSELKNLIAAVLLATQDRPYSEPVTDEELAKWVEMAGVEIDPAIAVGYNFKDAKPGVTTEGMALVGADFNPSKNPKVDKVKMLFAEAYDIVNDDRNREAMEHELQKALRWHMTGQVLAAQMTCVKLLTARK